MNTLEVFELTSPLPVQETPQRSCKRTLPEDIPIIEWRKCLALASEDVDVKTLSATTQTHLTILGDYQEEPQHHFFEAPVLRLPPQNKTVASDTFFPSV